MSANTNNLALNKKGTKVKITGVPKMFNVFGTSVQWLPSLTYLAIKFDLFTFQNQGYAITGWGVGGIIVLFLAFRSKIKETLKESFKEVFRGSPEISEETWFSEKTELMKKNIKKNNPRLIPKGKAKELFGFEF